MDLLSLCYDYGGEKENMYAVFSVLLSRPAPLPASNNASAFIFIALIFVLNKAIWQLSAQETDSMWLCDGKWNLQKLVHFTDVLH